MKYYIEKTVRSDFEQTVINVKQALKDEGFGVLSEIDIHEKLKEKLNVDYPKYRILGACNPPFAYEALKLENKIGVMLPCNVIVQELSDDKSEVAAVDPVASMQAVQNQQIRDIAEKIKAKLQKAIDSL